MKNTLPQYQTDYIISWDSSSNADHTCVSLSRVYKGKKGLECEVLGFSFEESGAISLRQACEEFEARQRREDEEVKNALESLRQGVIKETNREKSPQVPKGNKGTTEEQRKLYSATVKRLALMGVRGQTSQIITLAEEIERYRKKIIEMEAGLLKEANREEGKR